MSTPITVFDLSLPSVPFSNRQYLHIVDDAIGQSFFCKKTCQLDYCEFILKVGNTDFEIDSERICYFDRIDKSKPETRENNLDKLNHLTDPRPRIIAKLYECEHLPIGKPIAISDQLFLHDMPYYSAPTRTKFTFTGYNQRPIIAGREYVLILQYEGSTSKHNSVEVVYSDKDIEGGRLCRYNTNTKSWSVYPSEDLFFGLYGTTLDAFPVIPRTIYHKHIIMSFSIIETLPDTVSDRLFEEQIVDEISEAKHYDRINLATVNDSVGQLFYSSSDFWLSSCQFVLRRNNSDAVGDSYVIAKLYKDINIIFDDSQPFAPTITITDDNPIVSEPVFLADLPTYPKDDIIHFRFNDPNNKLEADQLYIIAIQGYGSGYGSGHKLDWAMVKNGVISYSVDIPTFISDVLEDTTYTKLEEVSQNVKFQKIIEITHGQKFNLSARMEFVPATTVKSKISYCSDRACFMKNRDDLVNYYTLNATGASTLQLQIPVLLYTVKGIPISERKCWLQGQNIERLCVIEGFPPTDRLLLYTERKCWLPGQVQTSERLCLIEGFPNTNRLCYIESEI